MTTDARHNPPFRVVAIDGGAASGKSSTSRILAEQCHFLHVDTGSHYRAVALACLQAGVPPEDGFPLRRFLGQLSLGSRVRDRESLICFDGAPPPDPADLRSAEVNGSVSLYAALPVVREAVKVYQRQQVQLARERGFKGIVMDGRDIGTVILPEADLKVFLVADTSTRQARRTSEGGVDAVADRDRYDSSRATAPLRPAADAVVIDNSSLPLQEVVRKIRALLERGRTV
jgi:CMP/dCMP kinase